MCVNQYFDYANALLVFIAAIIPSIIAYYLAVRKTRTEFMAERVVRTLLEHPDWTQRSFEAIKKKLGDGFDDKEIKRLLVRAGAVRFEGQNGTELWGLIKRNKNALK